jgi:hypothetical protein
MRISLVPGLLPRPASPRIGGLPGGAAEEKEINQAVLSGLIVAAPRLATGDDGEPVTVLWLSFATPGQPARCQIEVPDVIADHHRGHLCTDRRILVVGQLTGADSLRASSLWTWV